MPLFLGMMLIKELDCLTLTRGLSKSATPLIFKTVFQVLLSTKSECVKTRVYAPARQTERPDFRQQCAPVPWHPQHLRPSRGQRLDGAGKKKTPHR